MVAGTPRGPRRHSTEAHLTAFFQRNPGEELTQADVETKFGVVDTAAANALRKLTSAGVLEKVVVYRVKQASAPARPQRTPAPARAPSSIPVSAAPAPGASASVHAEAQQVEKPAPAAA